MLARLPTRARWRAEHAAGRITARNRAHRQLICRLLPLLRLQRGHRTHQQLALERLLQLVGRAIARSSCAQSVESACNCALEGCGNVSNAAGRIAGSKREVGPPPRRSRSSRVTPRLGMPQAGQRLVHNKTGVDTPRAQRPALRPGGARATAVRQHAGAPNRAHRSSSSTPYPPCPPAGSTAV